MKQEAVAETLSYEPQTQSVNKSQVITTDTETRHDIVEHKVVDGETLASIAEQYGVSTQTIKWANDINSDSVQVGVTLTIPPVNGVIHTVDGDDTVESIAENYKANAQEIIAFNDAELSGLKKGMKIVVPNGEKPAPEPAPVANTYATTSSTAPAYAPNFTPSYGGNTYSYGWCTWWAASRRAQLGAAIPNNWGNATTWDDRARASGYHVSSTPKVGAIAQNDYMAGGLGHVAIVEEVRSDGTVIISDMNGSAGWGAVGRSEVKPGDTTYRYIH